MRSQEDQAMLQAAVDRQYHPVYMTGKAEIVEYYKDTYGQKWTHKIAEALHGSIKNKQGEDVSIRNIQRRFQGERATKGEGRSSVSYRNLGKELPSIGKKLDGNQLTITVKGKRPDGRSFHLTTTFKGTDAYTFADNPDYGDLWEEYMGDRETFDSEAYGIEVSSVS